MNYFIYSSVMRHNDFPAEPKQQLCRTRTLLH